MAILRNKSPLRYTVVPNALLRDKDLDAECLGLLVYLLSHNDNWKVTIELIALDGRFGAKNKINRNLKRLRDLGYARMERFKTGATQWDFTDTSGHFLTNQDTQAHNPHPQNEDEEPHPQKPHLQKPDLQNGDVLRNTKSSEIPISSEVPSISGLADWLPKEAWDGFKAMRKEIRKPMTKRAEELMLKKLELWHVEGYDIGAILDASTLNGWQDCYLPKEKAQSVATITPLRKGPASNGSRDFRTLAEMKEERWRQQAADFINETSERCINE